MTQAAGTRVAVVIPTHNHARYLGEALRSVFAQSRAPDCVIVVDDGSSDDPAAVVARYPGVQFIRQANSGPSAARNRGLAATDADFVLFLDADDRLFPTAIEEGLLCHEVNPGCGFVYGAHRKVGAALEARGAATYCPCGPRPYHDLLKGNLVGSLPTALFARTRLEEAGAFDPHVRACEDYDLFLRLAQRYPVASHPAVIADYRLHPGSTAPDPAGMLEGALVVLERHRPPPSDRAGMQAYRHGLRHWKSYYARTAWRERASGRAKVAIARRAPVASFGAAAAAAARRLLPTGAWHWLRGRQSD